MRPIVILAVLALAWGNSLAAPGLGRNGSDAELIEYLDRLDGRVNSGTLVEDMTNMARALHLRVGSHRGFSRAWLRAALRAGGLVVALGNPQSLGHAQARTGGHYVSVIKREPDGQYLVYDPYGRGDDGATGRRYWVSEKTLRAFVCSHRAGGAIIAVYPPPKV